MYFDLPLFSDSLFMFSHSIILESSSLIKVCVSTFFSFLLNVLMVLDKVVSSAYIIKSNFFVDSGKSCIYMINNNGPRIDPCGTPFVKVKFKIYFLQFPCIVSYFLSNFQIVSELNLPVRNILAYVIESYDQLYQMPLIGPEKMSIGISFISILFMILSISSSDAYSVECLGPKPYWLGKKIPYSSKYDDNCLCIIFSNTFEIVGSREIGL